MDIKLLKKKLDQDKWIGNFDQQIDNLNVPSNPGNNLCVHNNNTTSR